MTRDEINDCLKKGEIDNLLKDLGFDSAPQRSVPITVKDRIYTVVVRREKRGFVIGVCKDAGVIDLPSADKYQLVQKFSKHYYEHLLILCGKDAQGGEMSKWLASIRPQNSSRQSVEVIWRENGNQQELHEKLTNLIFPLEEERNVTISDVVQRIQKAFITNKESVTQEFYNGFSAELKKFEEFIKGIEKQIDREQYAALMLNRLMFIYFIQKKKFLNNDIDYLSERLKYVQQKHGKDQFHKTFYRTFLRRLFKEGLDMPTEKRTSEINELLGKVPYINGGLFDANKLEIENDNIDIPDIVFIDLFNFFDEYKWHLDNRPTARNDEISPDVIGHIFEKYIHERAKMGAYYTQEDVTSHIAQNTILPHLLQLARENCKRAFEPDGIWRFLQDNPDNYIYSAVKHGNYLPDDVFPEDNWNTLADKQFANDTETWHEVIARRQRYHALKKKMSEGDICTINDLITNNIDIMCFVENAINNYEGVDFIAAIFNAIAGIRHTWTIGNNHSPRRGISVLDPACGSGAFLFAALNVLQPLYSACIKRMKYLVETDDKEGGGKKYPLFRNVLDEIKQHPNTEYWIYKTIILENLYGVDVMVEAAEITKLRLFLQLAAVAECDIDKYNLGLEPLPDIDYNIRSGNSLVGFSSMKHFEHLVDTHLSLDKKLTEKVRAAAETIKIYNDAFRRAQEKNDGGYVKQKAILETKLTKLNEELNRHLAAFGYNIRKEQDDYNEWKKSVRNPFHWLAEFYSIIEETGGFDVIIGNPPYVSKYDYLLCGYENNNPPDLYAGFIERIDTILNRSGHVGIIVQLNLGIGKKFDPYRKLILNNYQNSWFSSYGRIPSGLFDVNTRVRNIIYIARRVSNDQPNFNSSHTTKLHRWNTAYRPHLFPMLEYSEFNPELWNSRIPKIRTFRMAQAFEKCIEKGERLEYILSPNRNSDYSLYYIKTGYNWITSTIEDPPCYRGTERVSRHTGQLYFISEELRDITMLLINGKLMFIFWAILGDDFSVAAGNLKEFPIALDKIPSETQKRLLQIHKELVEFLPNVLQFKLNAGMKAGNYNLSKCRHITDKSDLLFADYMGISDIWEDIELYCSEIIRTRSDDE